MTISLQEKFTKLSPAMNESLRRRWAGCEALAVGRGGVSAVAAATGMSRNTVRRGMAEVQNTMPDLAAQIDPGRVRQPGGGRPSLASRDPQLTPALGELLEASTRGDPQSPLCWTSQSTRTLARQLTGRGHPVSHMTVDRLLRQMGYSLQANQKTRESTVAIYRDGQFRHIAAQVRLFQRAGQPVVSVDTKKRELVGNFKNPGREWRQRGRPSEVAMHDFQDEGWVSVGIDHDTAEFAVASIRQWWKHMGHKAYPHARRLLITADAGGSNGPRNRLWKWRLAELADELGLDIFVCHFPPGTSKWNRIEHRMFCHITENWRGRPLVSRQVVVNLIGHTQTRQGLHVEAALDKGTYPHGIKPTKQQFASLRIKPDAYHGDWNYQITPRKID
jgi:transposase